MCRSFIVEPKQMNNSSSEVSTHTKFLKLSLAIPQIPETLMKVYLKWLFKHD